MRADFKSQYLIESVLIVISILIAFAIDAWWEERQERAEERRVLTALRAEFQENADILPAYIEISEFAASAAAEVMMGIQEVGDGGRLAISAEQLNAFTVHGSFDPVRGASDAMLQSGELRFIQNQEFRRRLVRWPMLVADAIENSYFLRMTTGPRMLDYLAPRVDLGLADLIVRCRARKPPGECPMKTFELEATKELSGILTHVRGWSGEGAAELNTLRQEALDLVRILDQELARLSGP
jgi:hypothetical protein